MLNKKIIFMGTPKIAADYLRVLIENNYNIPLVFTQPPRKKNRGMKTLNSAVHDLSIEFDLPICHPLQIDDNAYNKIKLINPDIIIVMAYGSMLPKKILNLPKYGCINLHVSLLPRWRGAAPIEHAILNGDKYTGISIFKIEERLDSGPILVQKKISISDEMNKEELQKKITKIGKSLLLETIPKIFDENISLYNQDESLSTYASKFNSKMRKIDFFNSVDCVYNQIKAHAPNPGAWLLFKQERIKIIKAKKNFVKFEPSKIINNKFEISCSDGSIVPLLLQREGKKVMDCESFIRGFSFSVGDKVNE